MPISCSCDYDWYPEPGDYVWEPPHDFEELVYYRRARCTSCKGLIDVGAICLPIPRVRIPETEVECKIYGEDGEIAAADHYMCEHCGDIFLSLYDMGLCVSPYENQDELIAEYKRQKASGLIFIGGVRQ